MTHGLMTLWYYRINKLIKMFFAVEVNIPSALCASFPTIPSKGLTSPPLATRKLDLLLRYPVERARVPG
jgi:hypothetical protein